MLESDYIVGPRYHIDDLRPGSGGTVLLEEGKGKPGAVKFFRGEITIPKPIAGPINRFELYNKKWVASCEGCDAHSKEYTRKNEPALFHWAYRHRCDR